MKKFNKDGSDTKQWKAYKKRVLAKGGMIGNSPMAYILAKRTCDALSAAPPPALPSEDTERMDWLARGKKEED